MHVRICQTNGAISGMEHIILCSAKFSIMALLVIIYINDMPNILLKYSI